MLIKIVKLSNALLITSGMSMLTLLVNLKNIGNLQVENFYILALFSSINYLVMSLAEAFRVTVIATSPTLSLGGDISKFLHAMVTLSSILFALLGAFIYLSKQPLMALLHVNHSHQHTFMIYAISTIFASMVACWSYIILGYFYSIKRPTLCLLLVISASLLNMLLTYFFANYVHMGIYGIPSGTLLSSSYILLIAYYWLTKARSVMWVYPLMDVTSIILGFKRFIKVGAPVLLSYISLFAGIFVLNAVLSRISTFAVSGFGVAYRVQTLLILPAIAIGVSSAIFINEYLVQGNDILAKKILRIGLLLSSVIYIFISGLTYLYSNEMISVIVQEPSIHKEAVNYLLIVSPTYIFFGPFITFLVLSEQTGNGLWGLLLNALYFFITIIISYACLYQFHNSLAIYYSLSAMNVLGFISMLFIIADSKRIFYTSKE